MNTLLGKISNIQTSGAIMLVDVEVENQIASSIMIKSDEECNWLIMGNMVKIVFKETEVSIGIGLIGKLSLRNRFSCLVKQIEQGEILSKIVMQYADNEIVSIITTRSVKALELQTGMAVEAMVKANEIALMRV